MKAGVSTSIALGAALLFASAKAHVTLEVQEATADGF